MLIVNLLQLPQYLQTAWGQGQLPWTNRAWVYNCCLEPDPELNILLCSLVALLKIVLVCHSDCHALQQQLAALPGSCSCCVDQLQFAIPWNASFQKELESLTAALAGHALGQLLVALL